MPKFAEREREAISRKLLESGRRMFETHGLKKTSVADLTKEAGIAQGTFYLFFASKEELYFDILQQEEQEIRKLLIEPLLGAERVDRARFAQFLRDSVRALEERPLLRQLYDKQVMESLLRKLPEEKLQANFAADADDLLPLVRSGQRAGWLAPHPPETIVSLIRSIVLLSLQKQEIGEAHYEASMSLLIDLVAAGLVAGEGGREHD